MALLRARPSLLAALLISTACGTRATGGVEATEGGDSDAPTESDSEFESTEPESSTESGNGTEGDTGAEPDTCAAKYEGPTNPVGFPLGCSPRDFPDEEGFICCSDDPATLDGLALFSSDNNHLSAHGQCIPSGINAGLPNGCPIPCNPKWSAAQLEATCGPPDLALCCQTQELTARDCIFDVSLSCFRPVTGLDTATVPDCPTSELEQALGDAGYDPELARCSSDWSISAHDTHQDPGPSSAESACSSFQSVGIDFWSCINRLTVTDQRGLCLTKSPTVQVCPADIPEYVDACERLNADLELACG